VRALAVVLAVELAVTALAVASAEFASLARALEEVRVSEAQEFHLPSAQARELTEKVSKERRSTAQHSKVMLSSVLLAS
jgi:hypothetical protein